MEEVTAAAASVAVPDDTTETDWLSGMLFGTAVLLAALGVVGAD